jgi:hypothetical protein
VHLIKFKEEELDGILWSAEFCLEKGLVSEII